MLSNNLDSLPIAVILTGFDYVNIPFSYLNQLEKMGILNIYILLDDKEYLEAQQIKLQIFDGDEPMTILQHYQSHHSDNQLIFHVVNSGDASTEEEKLHFYLENVKENYLMNIFASRESLPFVTSALVSQPLKPDTVKYSISSIPLFTSQSWDMPSVDKSRSSQQAMVLLQREFNPCYCHQLDSYDILHYQWLFTIFLELTTLAMDKIHSNDAKEIKHKLKTLMKAYYKNIKDLEIAENRFEKTHKKSYFTLEGNPSRITKSKHKKNMTRREECLERFPQIIREMIGLYQLSLSYDKNALSKNARQKGI